MTDATCIYFFKKFTVKLKVKSKASKKFKKGISFVVTLVLHCFAIHSQFNTAVTQQLNNKLEF